MSDPRHEQFMELLSLHHGKLLGYLLALVHNLADAEDLFQQTALILWQKFDQFDLNTDFGHWACRIAHYEALNLSRSRRRSKVMFSDAMLEELAAVQLERTASVDQRRAALDRCLQRLSADDRELVEICYGRCRNIKSAAESLGRPVGGVYKSLDRVRRQLLACIGRQLPRDQDA